MASSSTSTLIRLATADDAVHWDQYVLSHEASSPYHLHAWKEAVEIAYGFKSYYVLASEQGRIVGVLPLIHLNHRLRSGALVGLPYCDVGGPLADDESAEILLTRFAVALGRHLKATSLDLRGAVNMQAALTDSDYIMEEVSGKVRMFLELPHSGDKLWQGFRSKLRSQVSKALKNGLTFAFSQDLTAFYKVFARNMHDLGSPVHSYEWFQAIFASYGERARLGLVFNGDTVVGGGVLLNTGKQISVPWASTLRDYNHLAPNMLLYWNFLKDSADKGFAVFDFGRSTIGEGTYHFKAQWGAQPIPLDWHVVQLQKKTGSAGNRPPQPVRQNARGMVPNKRVLAAKLWRYLPAWFVNRTGPVLRKYISL